MEQLPCPDGYLLDLKNPLAVEHDLLNNFLVAHEEKGWKVATKQLSSLRDKRLKFRIWMALLERLDYHRFHTDRPYRDQLHGLMYSVEEWKLDLGVPEIIEAMQRTGPLANHVSPYAPIAHLMAFVETHGYPKELAEAVRSYDALVRTATYKVNQTRKQMLNSRLDMLAWWDEWTPIDLKRCWSQRIRADYRGFAEPEKAKWRQIFHSIQGDEGVNPAPSWLKKSQAVAGEIDGFEAQLRQWFAPMQPGAVVPLSREGSFLLRSLIWLIPDGAKDIVTGVLHVQFKPKQYADKAIRAATDFAAVN